MTLLDQYIEREVEQINSDYRCESCGGEVKVTDAEDRNGDIRIYYVCLAKPSEACEEVRHTWA